MKTLELDEIRVNTEVKMEVLENIKSGKIFVYPTDTVYGLGCNALNTYSVVKIRRMKRTHHKFSVIAPSKEWIQDNLIIRFPEYLKKLPGPLTLIFEKSDPNFLLTASDSNSLAIRIPDHPFTKIIQEAGVPFISTSANVTGDKPIKKIDDSIAETLKKADYAIDAGVLDNLPSKIFDLSSNRLKVIRN